MGTLNEERKRQAVELLEGAGYIVMPSTDVAPMQNLPSTCQKAIELLERAGYTIIGPNPTPLEQGYIDGMMVQPGGRVEHKLVSIGGDLETAEENLDALVQQGWMRDGVVNHGLLLYVRHLPHAPGLPKRSGPRH